MARLLRTTGVSVLRKPAVVGNSITFRPVKVELAPSGMQGRRSHWRLQAPAAVGASITFQPVKSKLAKPPRASQHTLSRLHAPAVTGAVATPFLAAPVGVKLTRASRPPRTDFRLQPPAVVGASITFRPVQERLARWQPTRLTRSRIQPPSVVTAAGVVAPFAPVTIRLARPLAKRRNTYVLQVPAVVGASITFGPVSVRLARAPVPARKTTSVIRSPATLAVVVQALLAPVRVLLARSTRPRPTQSELRPPATLFQVLAAPILSRLARVKSLPQARSVLRKPVVVAPPLTFRPLTVKLARTPIRPFKSRLQPPTVITTVFAIITGYFQNTPAGQTRSSPDEPELQSGPAGQTGSSPRSGEFDAPDPGGQ